MLTKIKTAAVAAAMLAGTAIPAAAQDSCGVVVFFNNGQATLDAAAQAALTDFLSRNAGEPLTVTGYTDAVGSAASNQALSERRAASVAGTLQGANIVQVAGGGEAARPGTSGPNDPANRRVEITNTSCVGATVVRTTGGNPALGPGLVVGGLGILAVGVAAALDDGSSGTSTGTD